MANKDNASLDQVAVSIRKLLQDLLREHVKTAADRHNLAEQIGCSTGHVQSMLYEGKGGLDTWAKAFAYFYEFDAATLKNLKYELKRRRPLEGADKSWAQIQTELNASEEDRYFLARCAYEACRIKQELDRLK